MQLRGIISVVLILLSLSCREKQEEAENIAKATVQEQYFRQLSASATNVHFSNNIRESPNFNYFLYPFIYFGGGVAIGDVNNDSLPDIYLTGNMSQNALYLNQGDLKFREVGKLAGVEGVYNRWTTGVTTVDINNDGYLDLYVSVAGPREEHRNLLYVNQPDSTGRAASTVDSPPGQPMFVEQAEQWGIADNGHSIQSVFFDYDGDGDLDLYVGNYPPSGFQQKSNFFARKMQSPKLAESDHLYRNEGDHFEDVTQKAGLLNYGLTLGVSVADFNQDNLPDIYVSNDFNSSDCLYINQGDGTFANELAQYTRHTSNFGMGTDAADINNDGFTDLIQLDMMGSTNQQQKANMSAMNPGEFYRTVEQGLHYQYMKNTLQLNTGMNSFMDIGELAGVAYTDWSWGSLLFDMNNNGYKDIFITNGMRRNVNDNDFNAYFRIQKAYNKVDPAQYFEWLQKIPVEPIENFAFLNNGDLTFEPAKKDYGLSYQGFSQGAAYADLDRDGDLDVVVNNLDANTHIYENVVGDGNFLSVSFKGPENNLLGIGTKIRVYTDGHLQCQEMYLTRGYQSSVEPILHLGLDDAVQIDSIQVIWPDSKQQTLYQLNANQGITLNYQEASFPEDKPQELTPHFTTYVPDVSPEFLHQENEFDDFAREILLPHRMSQFGPALAVADINRDGLSDFYIGGAKGFPGRLYLQQENGAFRASDDRTWKQDQAHEDVSATFFDADGDTFPDLYVVSGGNEAAIGSPYYRDRLYLNNRQGGFVKSNQALPKIFSSGSSAIAADFDQDGDQDLFIGGRQIPGRYPLPADSYLLRNDSNPEGVKFTNVTRELAAEFQQIGMVTDAIWEDLNGDGWHDLIVVGEWMPVTIFHNEQGRFRNVSAEYGTDKQVGWWNTIASGDIDQDGDADLIAGNLGLNYKYKATDEAPFEIYADDFDNSGSLDIVLGYHEAGELYPLRGRECSSQQMPFIKKKIPNYTAFSRANLIDIYSSDKLSEALHYRANNFAHTVFINEQGMFSSHALPPYAQISSVNAIVLEDFNGDNQPDLFLGGNLYDSEVETPRNDASYGLYMTNDGNGRFTAVSPTESGVAIAGEIRAIVPLQSSSNSPKLLVARNNDKLTVVELATYDR